MAPEPLRVLLLGGTGEALALGQALEQEPGIAAVYSVAGVTRRPRLPRLPVHRGGFGGVAGLAGYLRQHGVHCLVDATHPFAAGISANAAAAARQTGTALLAVRRPAWQPGPGEQWHRVADMAAAAEALGPQPGRVLLTIGNQEVPAFCAAPHHHYWIRCLEPPERMPPGARILFQRGPFHYADECRLLREHGIDTLVTKNAGGAATRSKLDAARDCGVRIVMVERPPDPPEAEVATEVEQALAWLRRRRPAAADPRLG
ncbi:MULTISPECIES: cobalt-precorrin-6A reductase [Halorhodospira]|uniref:cobalt-precorrin-6A reductase n=1 Tax=Halorhodospira TaxID=85108 RepID=UPI001EE83D06|nr:MULTISPECIES: cobalt-precorrin-6A reductase [Halorhodospira]MCG5527639.1 cobalt-precorrin-6A reductase [Halorhodospira halophila]MCG5544175.1 cobalt-precorrin-6A reductase [Halorhodospira sp. 9628]